uniref:Uncharacterized protein n=1 Tax=Anguilla anguilla TaxID=7936 RepID=A0A0E9UGX4_ANGAN
MPLIHIEINVHRLAHGVESLASNVLQVSPVGVVWM